MEKYENIIKNINTIFRQGYVPSRGAESYRSLLPNGVRICRVTNCLEHACFNLTNKQLAECKIDTKSSDLFGNFEALNISNEKYEADILKLVRNVGLEVKKCPENKILKNNQWKVAMYFEDMGDRRDFHFMLQEKNGMWSSKQGDLDTVEIYQEPPIVFKRTYVKYGIYEITNPYKENRSKEDKTERSK